MKRSPDAPEVLERFHSELGLVDVLARQLGRTAGQAVEIDDLLSWGRQGLLEAARRFDAARGVPFRSFATFRVRGAMLDGVRSVSHLPRRLANQIRALEAARSFSEGAVEDALQPAPAGSTTADAERALDDHLASMATAMSLGLVANPAAGEAGELAGVSTTASPEEAAQRAELVGRVRAAIAELPEPEGTLLTRHYLEGEQLDLVARELNLSKSWASRLHSRAVGRLTKRLRWLENDP